VCNLATISISNSFKKKNSNSSSFKTWLAFVTIHQ
jgi:hypothetical protein